MSDAVRTATNGELIHMSSTSEHFINAWRHGMRILREEQATHIQFVWCPDRPSPENIDIGRCFPGDAYVSCVGMDGYDAGTAADWGVG